MALASLLLIFPAFLIVLVLIIFWKDIQVFFFPDNYNRVFMIENDGNISFWYQKKNKDLTFEFRNGLYYLSYAKTILEEKQDEEKKSISTL